MKLNADIRYHLNYAARRTNPVPCRIAFPGFIDTWLVPSLPHAQPWMSFKSPGLKAAAGSWELGAA